MLEETRFYQCPKGHVIPATPQFYAEDFSDGDRDADGLPMYEGGLWCSVCERAYGLTKLKEVEGNPDKLRACII